jgi:NhaP-type Na+/H+ or K+/H+ antiporter
MPEAAIALFALLVVAYVSQSDRLERALLTAPIVFTAAGAALGLTVFRTEVEPGALKVIAELTLTLVLFHDAAQVQPRELRSDAGLSARLLLIGLPLTIAAGYGMAWLLLPEGSVWLALLVAAALAPTDAGLGAATVLNPVVPVRVRRVLNVESGLNDGLATPVVLFAISLAGTEAVAPKEEILVALRELALGVLAGVLLAAAAGRLLAWAKRHEWIQPGLLPVATLAVPLLCYYGALMVHGNGFVATFVAGTAYAAAGTRRPQQPTGSAEPAAEHPLELTARVSVFLGYAVWTLFGVVAVAHLGELFTWRGLVFAVLSLTVLRMVPVALALVGTRLKRETVLFIGWFGPRGLASVVFALLAVETLTVDSELAPIIGAITTTVLLSVVLHGVSAGPWAGRYGAWAERVSPPVETSRSVEPTGGRGSRWGHLHHGPTSASDGAVPR